MDNLTYLNNKVKGEYSWTKKIIPIDINSDKKCEFVHIYANRIAQPNLLIYDIYKLDDKNNLIPIGRFLEGRFSFAEKYKNYFQIISEYYEGHKTNPIYYSKVYRYNGDKYELYKNPKKTRAEYIKRGLKAFKKQDYKLAKKFFSNSVIMPHHSGEDKLHDINNLVITLIKLGDLERAKSIYSNFLYNQGFTDFSDKRIDNYYSKNKLASACYNLGLIFEEKDDLDEAYRYFKSAYEKNPTTASDKKIKQIENKIKNAP